MADEVAGTGRAVEHCPTCTCDRLAREPCGAAWPASLSDVAPLRCRLPHGHRSPEHWHPALWPGQPPVVWADDDEG